MSLISAHKIFAKSLPAPPQCSKQVPAQDMKQVTLSHQCENSFETPSVFPDSSICSAQWKECGEDYWSLKRTLEIFQATIRSVHRRKIRWPTQENVSSDFSPEKYVEAVLNTILDIFHQLHSKSTLQKSRTLELRRIDVDGAVCGFTFAADEFRLWRVTAPILLLLDDDLFDCSENISQHTQSTLSKTLLHTPSVHSIIVTNLQEIVVFVCSQDDDSYVGTYERVKTTDFPLALRAVTAAYLDRELPARVFLNCPDVDYGIDKDLVFPEGPQQDPSLQALPTDETIFATCHRHSDFDLPTLVRDPERVLQFLRWCKYVQLQHSKIVAHSNDVLIAVTNEIGPRCVPSPRPLFPLELSELPKETMSHLKEIQRQCPLAKAGLADLLEQSKRFSLKIQGLIAEGTRNGLGTVYRCEITSIDDQPIHSCPSLCLKLFDDRFQSLSMPKPTPTFGLERVDGKLRQYSIPDERDPTEILHHLFYQMAFAETDTLIEKSAYEKLQLVQGSIIPWFYGAHQFTLPDGTVLYGLLMEYIDGQALDYEMFQRLSPSRQISLIQSLRQGNRVLDLADVTQYDWHRGQILLHISPITNIDHVVLIDFASTTQTREIEIINNASNFFDAVSVFLNDAKKYGLDKRLVLDCFGEPDDWDCVCGIIHDGTGSKVVKAPSLFPYILAA